VDFLRQAIQIGSLCKKKHTHTKIIAQNLNIILDLKEIQLQKFWTKHK
jgi:hypothetical protein